MRQLIKFLIFYNTLLAILFTYQISNYACEFDSCDYSCDSSDINYYNHTHTLGKEMDYDTGNLKDDEDINSVIIEKSNPEYMDDYSIQIFEENGRHFTCVLRICKKENNQFYNLISTQGSQTARYSYNNKYFDYTTKMNYLGYYGSKIIIQCTNGFDFVLNVKEYVDIDDAIKSLAYYIIGGKVGDLPDGFNTYDSDSDVYVEPPKNLKLSGVESNLFDGKKPIKFSWCQTVDLTGYSTILYCRTKYKYNWTLKFPFSQLDGDSGWVFENEVITAKYVNNQHLNQLEYKWWSSNCEEVISQQVDTALGQDTGSTTSFKMPDFFIYNCYTDTKGNKYYSKKIYIETYKDGTYKIIETKNDDDIDTDTTPIEDTEPEEYTGDTQHDSDLDTSFSINSITGILKDLVNSVGQFPDLMQRIFTFLPTWIWGLLAALIGLLVVLRILGR